MFSNTLIIIVTSGLRDTGNAVCIFDIFQDIYFADYSTPKEALNTITVKLAKELSSENLKIYTTDLRLTGTNLTGMQCKKLRLWLSSWLVWRSWV